MSSTSGAFVICDPTAGLSALITSIRLASAGNQSRNAAARPSIEGIQFDPGSIRLLKAESEKLQLAGGAKTLLAWSPLLGLVGESNAVHAAVSIHETDWVELAESYSTVDKLVFYSLATDARNHADSGELFGKPKLKQFWNAMADFYQARGAR